MEWLNKGRPNVHGVYTAIVVNEKDKVISRFEGTTPEEVINKLTECQVRAKEQSDGQC